MSDGSNKQKVLIVDDEPRNQRILSEILSSHADCLFASSGEEALHIMKELTPDLLLLDIMMPGMDGYSVCRQLRSDSRFESTKVILLSGKAMVEERLKGYEHGADDYITKPFVPEELLAKAKVYLRLTRLEKENLNRLSRFFPPHLKEHILSGKIENPFSWRRAEVTVIFIDLRGFTHFTETADPTTVMTLLHEYYHTVAKIAYKYGGSVGHLAGDGIMVFFNDLLKIDRPEEATTRMALESRKAITELSLGWRKKGIELGFGMGLAHGKATIGG
ncbi:MAG: response regulator, partial [Bdellovibrionales bacterium]